ncbi:hypothetical protein, partial [Komagataeibacter oboediens]|uniref:hypothetical protein n=1 Tax=Komagataeibacter oboediens TaxID=65958 RepID=UPI00241DC783
FIALFSEKTASPSIHTPSRGSPRFHSGRRRRLRVPGTQGEFICSTVARLSAIQLRFSVILIP